MRYPQQARLSPTACGGSYIANLPFVPALGVGHDGTSQGQQRAPLGKPLKVGNRTNLMTQWEVKAMLRRMRIAQSLKPGCNVWDVVRLIGVSEMTARKDLREMGWMAPKVAK